MCYRGRGCWNTETMISRTPQWVLLAWLLVRTFFLANDSSVCATCVLWGAAGGRRSGNMPRTQQMTWGCIQITWNYCGHFFIRTVEKEYPIEPSILYIKNSCLGGHCFPPQELCPKTGSCLFRWSVFYQLCTKGGVVWISFAEVHFPLDRKVGVVLRSPLLKGQQG